LEERKIKGCRDARYYKGKRLSRALLSSPASILKLGPLSDFFFVLFQTPEFPAELGLNGNFPIIETLTLTVVLSF
jgi:hypothetical protein